MSATPMLGRVGIRGERPLLSCLTRWETKLTNTSGSVTISEAFSRRSLFILEPGNREVGFADSNGMTFSGSRDGFFSLKTKKWDRIPEFHAGPMVKPENRVFDKSYLVNFSHWGNHLGMRSIPKRRRRITVTQKKPMVRAQFAASAVQNPQPWRSIQGRIKNMGKVGRTNQNVPSA